MNEESPKLDPRQRRWIEQAYPRVERLARILAPRLPHADVDELLSAGHEGLVQAAMRYDPTEGVPFHAFAHHRIKGAMIDAARRAVPSVRRRSRALRSIAGTQALLEQAGRTQAAIDETTSRSLRERVAAAADIVAQATTAIVLSRLAPVDPDAVAARSGGDAEEALIEGETRAALRDAMSECSDSERALLEGLYFEGRSMADMAVALGKSTATVSRRHARLMQRLGSRVRGRLQRGDAAVAGRDPPRRATEPDDP